MDRKRVLWTEGKESTLEYKWQLTEEREWRREGIHVKPMEMSQMRRGETKREEEWVEK